MGERVFRIRKCHHKCTSIPDPIILRKRFLRDHPHKKALEYGVRITGATVHFVDREYDSGPIILQKAVEVMQDDTPESLQRRVMEQAEWILLPEAIRLFRTGQAEGGRKACNHPWRINPKKGRRRMKVLVVGGGGREHAIVWKLAQSPDVTEIFCAPGNGGIGEIARLVPVSATDIDGIVGFSKKNGIDLVVVAPDDPLAMGMVDALEAAGIPAFGPRKDAAIIESSKVSAKNLMKKHNIPTAGYRVFDDSQEAREYVMNAKLPVVVKADGLALGKGVLICHTRDEAVSAVNGIMEERKFGSAGQRIVVEEYITGPEVSILAFTDGKTIKPMVSVQDHKRALDNDQGLNTGGMGTFTPSRHYTEAIAQGCMETIFEPTIRL